MIRFLFLCAMYIIGGLSAEAHEVRPAYLELTETSPGTFDVIWKQPVLDGRRLKIDPVYPDGCMEESSSVQPLIASIIHSAKLHCDLSKGVLQIEGLERTLTDVFVRIDFLEKDDVSTVLRPGATRLDLAGPEGAPQAAYFIIGVEHIIFGYDHLLFVLGLLLLVRPLQLIGTVTSFTVAHSITLGASTLGNISLPGAPVEIVIAMSIALLGAEAIYRRRGEVTLGQKWPWVIAFGFGLIHGFGFAGALSEIGLPRGAEIMALFMFNVGVEAGQLAFVAVMLVMAWIVRRFSAAALTPAQVALAYFIGITGSFWSIERIAGTFFA